MKLVTLPAVVLSICLLKKLVVLQNNIGNFIKAIDFSCIFKEAGLKFLFFCVVLGFDVINIFHTITL